MWHVSPRHSIAQRISPQWTSRLYPRAAARRITIPRLEAPCGRGRGHPIRRL